jgi:NAD(P)-dependent dehydrogenase (short-subunit alcohol dehydrogenase family)
MSRLDGQTAWITGAASGMGEAIAQRMAREGAAVVLADVQGDQGRAVAAGITEAGGRALFVETDVASSEAVRDSIGQAVSAYGGLQIIVNCAGTVQIGLLHECSPDDYTRTMDVNVRAIYHSVVHGIEHLRKNERSYMVNIGSVGSFITQALTPVYIASKYAVLGLTRSIAVDYADVGLRCNCVCPGITDTPMLQTHMNSMPDPAAAMAQRLRRVPMNVAMTPDDIARSVVYLSCEDSSGVTATSLVVDGGYISCAEWESGEEA